MRQHRVYDLPTRLFHWLFAGLFLTAFVIAKTIDDDSPTYSYHMLAGISLSFLVILRLVWGIIGTKHAKFSDFALNPSDLFSYLTGIFKGEKKRWAGHNPASSWAAVIMMTLALGSGVTGYLMTSAGGDKEFYEDIHELFANGFVVVAILHVAGIVLHTIRLGEKIGLSMIDGKKADVPAEQVIPSPKNGAGIIMLGLMVVFSLTLFQGYDSQKQNLQFLGSTLQLGDKEKDKSESQVERKAERDERDEEDDD